MPRKKTYTLEDLTQSALHQFWRHGYSATSIDDLVRATGVNRHGLYTEFGGKHGLFLACFERYRTDIVSPAFECVEAESASLDSIHVYFEHQITLAESIGLPGPGCFVANSATEIAPHDDEVCKRFNATTRVCKQASGMRSATLRVAGQRIGDTLDELAGGLVIFATGLWSLSRITQDAQQLRLAVSAHLRMVERTLAS